jgi:hypothetical protein
MRARAIGSKSLLTLGFAMSTHAVAVANSKLSPASASVLSISVVSETSKSLAARRSFAKPTAFGLRSGSGGLAALLSSWYLRPVTVPYLENMMTMRIAPSQPRSGVIVKPGARVLVLRSCSLYATLERARAGRGSPDPAQMLDRQVSFVWSKHSKHEHL